MYYFPLKCRLKMPRSSQNAMLLLIKKKMSKCSIQRVPTMIVHDILKIRLHKYLKMNYLHDYFQNAPCQCFIN